MIIETYSDTRMTMLESEIVHTHLKAQAVEVAERTSKPFLLYRAEVLGWSRLGEKAKAGVRYVLGRHKGKGKKAE